MAYFSLFWMHVEKCRNEVVTSREACRGLGVARSRSAHSEESNFPLSTHTCLLHHLKKEISPILLSHGCGTGACHAEVSFLRYQLDHIPIQRMILASCFWKACDAWCQFRRIQDNDIKFFCARLHVIGDISLDIGPWVLPKGDPQYNANTGVRALVRARRRRKEQTK
jgi:hypothetical protein